MTEPSDLRLDGRALPLPVVVIRATKSISRAEPDGLLLRSDPAMYEAKEEGQGRTVLRWAPSAS